MTAAPGSAFVDAAEPGNALRPCFTHADAADIAEGVRRLRQAYDGVMRTSENPQP